MPESVATGIRLTCRKCGRSWDFDTLVRCVACEPYAIGGPVGSSVITGYYGCVLELSEASVGSRSILTITNHGDVTVDLGDIDIDRLLKAVS